MRLGEATMDRVGVLLERLPLVTYALSLEGDLPSVYVSPQLESLFGLSVDECLAGKGYWTERIVPEDRSILHRGLDELRRTGEQMTVEYRVRVGGDRLVWVRDVAVLAPGADGGEYVNGFLVDVTREKELERELAAERALVDSFFSESPTGLGISDRDGRYLRVNEAFARIIGSTPDAAVGRTLAELQPEFESQVAPLREWVKASGRPAHQSEVRAEIDGEERVALVNYFPVDADGETHVGRVVVDITKQRRAEAERAAAELQYRRLIEQLPLVTYVNEIVPAQRPVYVSPQAEELFGHAAESFLTDPGLGDRVVHPDDFETVCELEAAARAAGVPYEHEYRIIRSNGEIRWVFDQMETVRDEHGEPLFEQGFLIDVTARHESEAQFRAVFDGAPEALTIVDDDGRYIDVNPKACELFGRSRDAILALRVGDATDYLATDRTRWHSFVDAGHATGQLVVSRPDGTVREVEFAARANMLPGRHLSVLRDVTEHKRLQQELWRAQKLESVGRLAGGVAHDFNNLLTAIRGYGQLLLADLAPGTTERLHAVEIERAAERATRLTAQLLAFGRRQMLEPRPVDLNALVGELAEMLDRIAGQGIELAVEDEPALRAVRVDPAQVEQVLVQLVVNAADAMPAGGRIAIAPANVRIAHDASAPPGDAARELPDGHYVRLAVTDSGTGFDDAAREHLFEPFFTTKEAGAGSGLGLATAYGIAKQSGGTITASSEPGAGATFALYLPEAAPAHDPGAAGRGETVLVVESDPAVRDVLFETLTDDGYRALVARTTRDALRLAERAGPVDLVLGTPLAVGARVLPLERPFTMETVRAAVRRSLDGDTVP